MDEESLKRLIDSVTQTVQAKMTEQFSQLKDEVKKDLENINNKGDGETKVSNTENLETENSEPKYDPDAAGVELLRKMMGKENTEEENEIGDERKIVVEHIDLTKFPFPIEIQENALIQNETLAKSKGAVKDKEVARVQRGKDLVATQWDTAQLWSKMRKRVKQWDEKFKHQNTEEKTPEKAAQLKRLKTEMENKDETEEQISDQWSEMEDKIKALPAGRKEKEELLEWADGCSMKQTREYWESKAVILKKIQDWENSSTVAVDRSQDNGRIEKLAPNKMNENMSPVEFEDWWETFSNYLINSFFSQRTNTPFWRRELEPLLPNGWKDDLTEKF